MLGWESLWGGRASGAGGCLRPNLAPFGSHFPPPRPREAKQEAGENTSAAERAWGIKFPTSNRIQSCVVSEAKRAERREPALVFTGRAALPRLAPRPPRPVPPAGRQVPSPLLWAPALAARRG